MIGPVTATLLAVTLHGTAIHAAGQDTSSTNPAYRLAVIDEKFIAFLD